MHTGISVSGSVFVTGVAAPVTAKYEKPGVVETYSRCVEFSMVNRVGSAIHPLLKRFSVTLPLSYSLKSTHDLLTVNLISADCSAPRFVALTEKYWYAFSSGAGTVFSGEIDMEAPLAVELTLMIIDFTTSELIEILELAEPLMTSQDFLKIEDVAVVLPPPPPPPPPPLLLVCCAGALYVNVTDVEFELPLVSFA